jgi:hypothetical protein
MVKTNREKNTNYDQRQQARVRPKPKEFNFIPLEAVINSWIGQKDKA